MLNSKNSAKLKLFPCRTFKINQNMDLIPSALILSIGHIISLCHTYPGLPSGVLGCPRLVLGYGMGVGFGFGLGIGVWGRPRTVVGNPR